MLINASALPMLIELPMLTNHQVDRASGTRRFSRSMEAWLVSSLHQASAMDEHATEYLKLQVNRFFG